MNEQQLPARLECGHELSELVQQIADGVQGDLRHQRTCVHCQFALAELGEIWDRMTVLAAEEVRAPQGLDTAVMRRVRRALFLAEVSRLVTGVIPRLGRALLVYAGLTQRGRLS